MILCSKALLKEIGPNGKAKDTIMIEGDDYPKLRLKQILKSVKKLEHSVELCYDGVLVVSWLSGECTGEMRFNPIP